MQQAPTALVNVPECPLRFLGELLDHHQGGGVYFAAGRCASTGSATALRYPVVEPVEATIITVLSVGGGYFDRLRGRFDRLSARSALQ
jgi:hypothetical protein